MAIKLSLSNIKGGCGKTTSAVCISHLLAKAGYKVLIVDFDPQRNTTRMLNAQQEEEINYQLLFCEKISDKNKMKKFIYKTQTERLDIIPASSNLSDIIYEIYNLKETTDPTVELYFKNNLSLVEDEYDYVIFDTSPFKSTLTYCTLSAADRVMVPIETDNFSYEGVLDLIQIIDKLNKDYSLSIRFSGIFLTSVNDRTILYRDLSSSYEQMFGSDFIQCYIRTNEKVKQANTVFVNLLDYDRKNSVNLDYTTLLIEVGLIDTEHYKKLEKYILNGDDI